MATSSPLQGAWRGSFIAMVNSTVVPWALATMSPPAHMPPEAVTAKARNWRFLALSTLNPNPEISVAVAGIAEPLAGGHPGRFPCEGIFVPGLARASSLLRSAVALRYGWALTTAVVATGAGMSLLALDPQPAAARTRMPMMPAPRSPLAVLVTVLTRARTIRARIGTGDGLRTRTRARAWNR